VQAEAVRLHSMQCALGAQAAGTGSVVDCNSGDDVVAIDVTDGELGMSDVEGMVVAEVDLVSLKLVLGGLVVLSALPGVDFDVGVDNRVVVNGSDDVAVGKRVVVNGFEDAASGTGVVAVLAASSTSPDPSSTSFVVEMICGVVADDATVVREPSPYTSMAAIMGVLSFAKNSMRRVSSFPTLTSESGRIIAVFQPAIAVTSVLRRDLSPFTSTLKVRIPLLDEHSQKSTK